MKRIVKVCGMCRRENISQIAALGPDMMGFIAYPPSPRNFPGLLSPDDLSVLPPSVVPVLVTVDCDPNEVIRLVDRYGFRAVQLHGGESPQLCEFYRSAGLKVMKAISVGSAADLIGCGDYSDAVDLFVFDTKSPSAGGSGKKFDWGILDSYTLEIPFLLSGGIGPDDIPRLKSLTHPSLAGFDLNSRFEISPGVKSVEQLKDFINEIRILK